jgi:DNA-binding transcriptional regulator LsrR (DeoR family)
MAAMSAKAQTQSTKALYGKDLAEQNFTLVWLYYRDHLGCTRRECAEALGLSEMAVGRHVERLRREWLEAF